MQNQAALDNFIRQPVSREMVRYLADKACGVIRCEEVAALKKEMPPTPPPPPPHETAPRFTPAEPALPSLEEFITSLVEKSHVQVSTLMSSLIYLARLQKRLPPVAKGMRCTVHRIFLASLILAAKNLNDSSPKNKHWARYTCVSGFSTFGFSVTEVNLMEKQLLFLLDWDLRITNTDLFTHFEPFLVPIRAQQQRLHDDEEHERKLKLKLREKEVIKQQYRELSNLQELQRRHQLAIATYESNYNAITQAQQASHTATSRHVRNSSSTYAAQPPPVHLQCHHKRTSSRLPSLSPPSSMEIPRLARSGTVESLASSSANSSSRGTPASNISPTIEIIAAEYVHLAGRRSCSASPGSYYSLKGVQAGCHQLHLTDREEESGKTIKKIKTSGGLFARFLGGARAVQVDAKASMGRSMC
jgi:hypothetical protein